MSPFESAGNACKNCGAPAPRNFCPECGQETHPLPSPAELFHELLGHFLSWESKAARTLFMLVLRPGALTAEYLAGRRARYVRPLRLYLWVSVLVIGLTEAFGLHLGLRFAANEGIYLFEPARTAEEAGGGQLRELRPMQYILEHFDTPGLQRFKALSTAEQAEIVEQQRHRYVQYFLVLLVPAFALMLGICYRNRHRPYAEHLLFCVHAQSFLLIMLLIEAKLPGVVALLVSLWVIAYFYLALRRVYRGGWPETLLRGSLTLALSVLTFLLAGALMIYALLEL